MKEPNKKQANTAVHLKDCRIGDVIHFPTGYADWTIEEHQPYYNLTTLKSNNSGACRQYDWDLLVYPVLYAGYPKSPRQNIEVIEVRAKDGKLLGVEFHLNGRLVSTPFSQEDADERYRYTLLSQVID